MFRFDTKRYDFWSVFQAINEHFPIGVSRSDDFYFSYPGLSKLESLLIDKIHKTDVYEAVWGSFIGHLANLSGLNVYSMTMGQEPSYSGTLEIEKFKHDNYTRKKRLLFCVSILGNFYSVIGTDGTIVKIGERSYCATNYLVVSPENEFEVPFNTLTSEIEKRFSQFRFVLFAICKQIIAGLNVNYSEIEDVSVFNALFNDQIDTHVDYIGDPYYKSSDWAIGI